MNLFKSLSIYTLISMWQTLLTFLTISFFSFSMKIEVFGIYNLYLAIIPFLLNFMILGSTASVGIFYHKTSSLRYRLYLGQIVFYILPISFILGIILYLSFANLLSNYFGLDKDILLLLVLLVFFQILPQVLFTYFQTSFQSKRYVYFNITYSTINFILTLSIFVIYQSLFSIFLALLLNAMVFSIISLVSLIKDKLIVNKFNKNIFKEVFTYGLPLVIHTTGTTLLFMSDRFFISKYIGNEAVAYYSVSLQLSMIILIVVNSFAAAWGPYLFKELKLKNNIIGKYMIKKMYYFIIFFFLLPLILYFFQELILRYFFAKKYLISLSFVLIIGFGYSAMGIYKIFIGFLHYAKMTKLISFLTVTALSINLILNYYMINRFGTIGVAYSTFISMSILSILTIILVNKYYKINWRLM
jgi:O-antigen/teichoic acid export membrane protein